MTRRPREWARVFSRSHTCVGVDIGSSAVKIIQLERRGSRVRLTQFGWRELSPTVVDGVLVPDPHRLKSALIELIRELDVGGSPVAISVSGPSVIVKRICVSGVEKNSLDEYLTWEGHQYIPYAMRDIYFDYWILPPSRHRPATDDIELLLVAAKQQVVESRKMLLEDVGMHPIVCDVDGLALMTMVMGKSPAFRGRSFGIVNVGASSMNVVFAGNEDPLLVRDVSFEEIGSDSHAVPVDAEAQRAFQGEAADPVKPPAPEEIVREVQCCVELVMERYPELGPDKIFLCGGQSRHEHLKNELQTALSVPTIALNPFDDIEASTTRTQMDPLLDAAHLGGVALGLALHNDHHGAH